MTDIDKDTLDGLAAKIDGLDLTDGERVVLRRILQRAGEYEPDVSGYQFSYRGIDSGADLGKLSFSLGLSAGIFPSRSLYEDPFDPTDPTKPPPP